VPLNWFFFLSCFSACFARVESWVMTGNFFIFLIELNF
jgi:hypothetical protein